MRKSSILNLPFVRKLDFFDGGKKACLTLQEPGKDEHFVLLNSYEKNASFKLHEIFNDFVHSGALVSHHPAGGPSRYFLANLLS